jgi:hypothetical protein
MAHKVRTALLGAGVASPVHCRVTNSRSRPVSRCGTHGAGRVRTNHYAQRYDAVMRLDAMLAAHPFVGLVRPYPPTSTCSSCSTRGDDHVAVETALRQTAARGMCPIENARHARVLVCYDELLISSGRLSNRIPGR